MMRVLERCAAKDWQQREREAIANAKAAGLKILNLADGGDQPFCSAAVRAENGRTNAITRTGTPHKKRVYQIKHKLGILLRDGFVGESARAKMRQAALKRPDLFGEWAAL